MLFQTKPLLYLQLLDRSIRYMAVHPKNHTIIEQDELIFDTNVLEEGHIVHESMIETRLDALIREKKWKNAKAHIILMEDFVTVREESIPAQLSEAEIKEYLNLHINRSIRIPFENPIFDFEIVDKNEEQQKIILVAYPREYTEQYQNILQKASLKPEVADISSLCLYRVAQAQGDISKSHGDNHVMLLQWNPYNNNIMMFHNDVPSFNRYTTSLRLSDSWTIDSDKQWQWTLSEEELSISINEQLDALGRFLDFYQYSVLDGEGSVSEIILSGSYPDLPDIKSRISERFGVEIKLLTLPDAVDHRFATLYGLSVKEKGGRK